MGLPIIIDTFVDSYSSNSNYIYSENLVLRPTPPYTYTTYILMKPPLAINARLNLYVFDAESTTCTVYVRRITSQWDEYTVTWNTKPTYDSYDWASVVVYNIGWYQLDISTLVNKWIDETYPNYGIILIGSGGWKVFASAEYSDINKRPYLDGLPYGYIALTDSYNNAYNSNKYVSNLNLDFSSIVAGSTSQIAEVRLYNTCSYAVSNIIVFLENLPPNDTIEISKFNNPFIPSQQINFDGTFAPGADIGTFYVRVKPGEDSSGSKSFRIKAKATPV